MNGTSGVLPAPRDRTGISTVEQVSAVSPAEPSPVFRARATAADKASRPCPPGGGTQPVDSQFSALPNRLQQRQGLARPCRAFCTFGSSE